MSSATETLTFKILADSGQADAQLQKTRQSAERMGGGLSLVKGGLEGIDRAEREASKALRGLGGAFAFADSKAMGMFGALGDVSGLLSGGGPLVVGLAAAGGAAMLFSKALDSLATSRQAAFASGWAQVDEITGKLHGLNDELSRLRAGQPKDPKDVYAQNQADLEAMRQRLEIAKSELAVKKEVFRVEELKVSKGFSDYGFQPAKDAMRQKESEVAALEATIGQTEKIGVVRVGQALEALAAKNDQIANEANRKLQEAKRRHEEFLRMQEAELKSIKGSGEGMTSVDGLYPTGEGSMNFRDVARSIGDTRDKAAEQRQRQEEKARNDQMKEEKERAREYREIWERELAKEEQMWTSWQDQKISAGEQAVGSLAGATTQFIAMSIEGQKYAFESASAMFLASVGDQLIGMGIRDGAAAIGMAITGNPAAGPMGLLAAAEIATGVGMGGAGAVLGMNIGNAKASDETREERRSAAMRSERGTGMGSSGSGSSAGGGTTVIINYGVGGPPAEHTAREVSRGINRANRDGIGRPGGGGWR